MPSGKHRRRHPLLGMDGVVKNISDHPVCALLTILMAQPSLLYEEGTKKLYDA